MARLIATVNLDAQVHERWSQLRYKVSELLRYNAHSLGLGPMLGLLLDHWEENPPDLEWLKVKEISYPKRGRPRRSDPANMTPVVALKKVNTKGHVLFTGRRPMRYHFCRNCNLMWDPAMDRKPTYDCPTIGTYSMLERKVWTKADLRALNFEEDEIQWAAE